MEHKITLCFHSLTVYKMNMNVSFSQILGPFFFLYMWTPSSSVLKGLGLRRAVQGTQRVPAWTRLEDLAVSARWRQSQTWPQKKKKTTEGRATSSSRWSRLSVFLSENIWICSSCGFLFGLFTAWLFPSWAPEQKWAPLSWSSRLEGLHQHPLYCSIN